MAGLRTKNTCFQAKEIEHKLIQEVADFLDMNKSEFLRNTIMKEVEKQLKKMKG